MRSSGSGATGSETIALDDDWREFLFALISTGTKFLLIGGHAVAVHAEPRFTEDLDVFVAPTLENARRLHRALVAFGFGNIAPAPVELAVPDRVWMLGRKPRRIDILTGISGVSFARASRGRVYVELGKHRIPVIGRDALLLNKMASAPDKDRFDIALLKRHRVRSPHAPATRLIAP